MWYGSYSYLQWYSWSCHDQNQYRCSPTSCCPSVSHMFHPPCMSGHCTYHSRTLQLRGMHKKNFNKLGNLDSNTTFVLLPKCSKEWISQFFFFCCLFYKYSGMNEQFTCGHKIHLFIRASFHSFQIRDFWVNSADSLHLLASHWPSGLVTHLMPAAPLQVHTSVLPR